VYNMKRKQRFVGVECCVCHLHKVIMMMKLMTVIIIILTMMINVDGSLQAQSVSQCVDEIS